MCLRRVLLRKSLISALLLATPALLSLPWSSAEAARRKPRPLPESGSTSAEPPAPAAASAEEAPQHPTSTELPPEVLDIKDDPRTPYALTLSDAVALTATAASRPRRWSRSKCSSATKQFPPS